MTRILAGTLRSRHIITPKGPQIRPTSSQIRQAVFNICQNEIEGASFLDICAGSGAIGLEALSQGAKFCEFIEHDRESILAIKENIKQLKLEDRSKVHFGDALLLLKKLKGPFDIIYFDPPYTKNKGQISDFTQSVLIALDTSNILLENATVFVEESSLAHLTLLSLQNLKMQTFRKYGSSQLFCYQKVKV